MYLTFWPSFTPFAFVVDSQVEGLCATGAHALFVKCSSVFFFVSSAVRALKTLRKMLFLTLTFTFRQRMPFDKVTDLQTWQLIFVSSIPLNGLMQYYEASSRYDLVLHERLIRLLVNILMKLYFPHFVQSFYLIQIGCPIHTKLEYHNCYTTGFFFLNNIRFLVLHTGFKLW